MANRQNRFQSNQSWIMSKKSSPNQGFNGGAMQNQNLGDVDKLIAAVKEMSNTNSGSVKSSSSHTSDRPMWFSARFKQEECLDLRPACDRGGCMTKDDDSEAVGMLLSQKGKTKNFLRKVQNGSLLPIFIPWDEAQDEFCVATLLEHSLSVDMDEDKLESFIAELRHLVGKYAKIPDLPDLSEFQPERKKCVDTDTDMADGGSAAMMRQMFMQMMGNQFQQVDPRRDDKSRRDEDDARRRQQAKDELEEMKEKMESMQADMAKRMQDANESFAERQRQFEQERAHASAGQMRAREEIETERRRQEFAAAELAEKKQRQEQAEVEHKRQVRADRASRREANRDDQRDVSRDFRSPRGSASGSKRSEAQHIPTGLTPDGKTMRGESSVPGVDLAAALQHASDSSVL